MSVTVGAIEDALRIIFNRMFFAAVGIAFLLSIISYLVARNITRPLEEIKTSSGKVFSR
jgi:hypothetical protein